MAPKTPSVDITVVTKNLKALQAALEHSLTIQRVRLQEIIDDLVSRGSLTRADADRLITQLFASSKDYSQSLLQVLDAVATEARKNLGGIAPVMATAGKTAGKTAGRIADTVRQAPRLVTKTPTKPAAKAAPRSAPAKAPKKSTKGASRPAAAVVPNEPIPGYSELTVAQIKPRLTGLSATALRRVRDVELAGKARKSVLAELERRLKSS